MKINKELKYFLPALILGFISVSLICISFVIPPTGIIDSSVLKGVGELFGFATLFEIPHCIMISNGKKIQIKHNNTELNVEDDENK